MINPQLVEFERAHVHEMLMNGWVEHKKKQTLINPKSLNILVVVVGHIYTFSFRHHGRMLVVEHDAYPTMKI